MATPKQHDSKGKVGHRRSQKNLKKQKLSPCPNCKAPKEGHRACANCDFHETASAKKKKMEGGDE